MGGGGLVFGLQASRKGWTLIREWFYQASGGPLPRIGRFVFDSMFVCTGSSLEANPRMEEDTGGVVLMYHAASPGRLAFGDAW